MDILEELSIIGEYQRDIPVKRAAAVARARAAGHTWRAIAEALGMTQHAIITADRAHRVALISKQ